MPNYDEVRKMIQTASNSQERREALQQLKQFIPVEDHNKQLSTLSKGSAVNSLRLGDIDKYTDNVEAYNRVKDMVVGK